MKNPNNLNINSLSGDWCDNDTIMLHACFQLLIDCVENEQLLTGHIDWSVDESHANAKKEIEELYQWWNTRKKDSVQNQIDDFNEQQYLKDNAMLIRLINVRKYLWT